MMSIENKMSNGWSLRPGICVPAYVSTQTRPVREESNVPKLRTYFPNIYCVLILSCRYMIYLGQLGLDSAKTALIPLPAKLVFLSCLPISTDYQHQIRVFLLYICIPNILADWADRPSQLWGIFLVFFGSTVKLGDKKTIWQGTNWC